MHHRLYWKLSILELIGALAVLVFFAPAIRATFAPASVTILERSDDRAVVELVLPSYQIETRQGSSFYSAITLDAPGWTSWRDARAGSTALPFLEYRLPAVSDTMRADLRILEQETENQLLTYPLSIDGALNISGANVRAYVDTSGGAPTIVIQWRPFSYSADSRELLVQRRLKIQIEN